MPCLASKHMNTGAVVGASSSCQPTTRAPIIVDSSDGSDPNVPYSDNDMSEPTYGVLSVMPQSREWFRDFVLSRDPTTDVGIYWREFHKKYPYLYGNIAAIKLDGMYDSIG